MKAAVIQMNSIADKQANIIKACAFVKEALAQKADFVLLPEVFNYRGRFNRKEESRVVKEAIPGPSVEPFLQLSRQSGAAILLGSIYEAIPHSEKVYNSSVFIDPQGKVGAIYRKQHLFDAVIGRVIFKESYCFKAGSRQVSVKLGGFMLGLSVCYDLRFPEMYRRYARDGVNVLTVPSAFTKTTGEAHWEPLLRARAIENLSYVLAPNQIGPDGRGVMAYGHSMIIDPWGKVLAEASADKEEIIYAHLDMAVIKQKRSLLPAINKS